MKTIASLSLALLLFTIQLKVYAIIPNPIISRGRPVFTSSGTGSFLVDNKFKGTSFKISNHSWISINLGKGASKVFFTWNNPAYTWMQSTSKCTQTFSVPVDYTIQTSANSTNGFDGTWTNTPSIKGNEVTARGHACSFSGASWIRMSIDTGSGEIDEIEVFDISAGGNDLWFFPGTSISANTFKGTPPIKNTADLLTAINPKFTPAIIRGGVPCINSTDFVNNLPKYFAAGGNAKYWAIEMGTNDGYNSGNTNVATFKSNLQIVIDACKKAGIEPIIARVLSTNEAVAKWQIHPDYVKAVDELTIKNKLIRGPDFYAYFIAHPDELDPQDGIHPIESGAASIQKLWADKMLTICKSALSDK